MSLLCLVKIVTCSLGADLCWVVCRCVSLGVKLGGGWLGMSAAPFTKAAEFASGRN